MIQLIINSAFALGLVLSAVSHILTDRRVAKLERNKTSE